MEQQIKILTPSGWTDYELIDSGNEEKLERYGSYLFVRPEPRALWPKAPDQTTWSKAAAVYERNSTGGGKWVYNQQLPASWKIGWKDLTFIVKPTGFKHMGIFPEQASIWDVIIKKITSADRPISVLNMFAYTGGNTLAAAIAGASVTHLDASKDILTWARDNAIASGLDKKPIRWIPEDATTFVRREINRGNKYDVIIMDPPKFGRGSRSEIWKIEEDLPKLVELCTQILSPNPLLVIINAYAVSYSAVTLANMLALSMSQFNGQTTVGELGTKQTSNGLIVPNSIFGLWESQ